ncbi:MAG: fliL [Bacillales bacterium]|jgi:flagellar FliL protein|nr:fliL [Bacillales bacterium]
MKLHVKTILILIAITAIGVAIYFYWQHKTQDMRTDVKAELGQLTVDDLISESVDTDSITANFADGDFIKVQFKLIIKSQTKAEEIKKLSFRTKDNIIKTINQIKKSDAVGPNGVDLIENSVKKSLNKDFGENVVTDVYLVDKLIQ